jgi:hypothetical protein
MSLRSGFTMHMYVAIPLQLNSYMRPMRVEVLYP